MFEIKFFNFIKVVLVAILYTLMKVSSRLKKKEDFFVGLYDLLSVWLINSNHPRRLFLLFRSFKFLDVFLPSYLKSTGEIDRSIELGFVYNKVFSSEIEKSHFIFIGDSHSEFLSRLRKSEDDFFYSNAHALWFGPVTLFGFSSVIKQDKLAKYIKKIKFNNNISTIYIIWTLGTIDVRASIYELNLRNVVDDNDGLKRLIDTSLESLNSSLITPFHNKVSRKCPNTEIKSCFLAASNSQFPGDEPKSIRDVKLIRKKNPYPTFGSVETRRNFCDIVNVQIHRWAIDNNYLYCDPYEATCELSDMDSSMVMRDGIHITDSKKVCELGLSLIDMGNCSRV